MSELTLDGLLKAKSLLEDRAREPGPPYITILTSNQIRQFWDVIRRSINDEMSLEKVLEYLANHDHINLIRPLPGTPFDGYIRGSQLMLHKPIQYFNHK